MTLKIDQLRQLSMVLVLEELGCSKKLDSKNKWRSPDGDFMTLDGGQIYNHDKNVGGGGAIDAVQIVTGWEFGKCIAWLRKLAEAKGEHITYQEKTESGLLIAKELELPVPSEKRWNEVFRFLTQRSLDQELILSLHRSGDIYAQEVIEKTSEVDRYSTRKTGELTYITLSFVNVVFAKRDLTGNIVSVSRRGIQGDFKSVLGPKDKGAFCVGNKVTPLRIAIVESAIDAISYFQCHTTDGLLVMSTDGAGSPFMSLIERHPHAELVLAQDADEAGDRMAEHISMNFESYGRKCIREKPGHGKDWNEYVYNARLVKLQSDNSLTGGTS